MHAQVVVVVVVVVIVVVVVVVVAAVVVAGVFFEFVARLMVRCVITPCTPFPSSMVR